MLKVNKEKPHGTEMITIPLGQKGEGEIKMKSLDEAIEGFCQHVSGKILRKQCPIDMKAAVEVLIKESTACKIKDMLQSMRVFEKYFARYEKLGAWLREDYFTDVDALSDFVEDAVVKNLVESCNCTRSKEDIG